MPAKEGKDVWNWEYGYEEEESSNCSSSSSSSDVVEQEEEEVNPSNCCSIRKILKTECRIVEVENGKFIKKCEKTEQILKDCIGKPAELVKSTTEYTNEDVTNEKSRWFMPSVESELKTKVESELNSFSFPGLRDDIETIEKNVFGGLSRFFEAAEEMVSDFDKVFGGQQHNDGDSSSSSSFRLKIPIESHLEKEKKTSGEQRNDSESVYSEFSGQIKDV